MERRKKKKTYSEKITVRITKEMHDAMFELSVKNDKPLARVFREFAERGFYEGSR